MAITVNIYYTGNRGAARMLAGRTAEDGALLLSPGEPVTRAEFAAVLQTLCESVLP